MTTNQIAYWTLKETNRANRAKEAENRRHNEVDEEIRRTTNANTLYLGNRNADEQYRNNTVVSLENQRSHMANEQIAALNAKTQQQHLAIDAQNADTNARNAATNAMNAATNAGQLVELNRSNLVNEQIKQQQYEELVRNDKAKEDISRFGAVTGYSLGSKDSSTRRFSQEEAVRHDVTTENETKRKNLIDQQLEAAGLMHRINNDTARTQNEFLKTTQSGLSKLAGAKQ